MNYSWSEVQTKDNTLAGRALRNRIAHKVRAFDLQNGSSPSFGPNEERADSDEEPHFAKKKLANRKNKAKTPKHIIENGVQSSISTIHDLTGAQYTEVSKRMYCEGDQMTGQKRERFLQPKQSTDFKPQKRMRFMDIHLFDESAETYGYSKTIM